MVSRGWWLIVGIFKRSCPSCDSREVIVSKCRKCYSFICSSCGLSGYCRDCYASEYANPIKEAYFEDKKVDEGCKNV